MKRNNCDCLDRVADIFIVLLIAAVIGLKIAGIITLSWFWLFSPIIFLFGLGVVLALIVMIVCIINIFIESKKEKE